MRGHRGIRRAVGTFVAVTITAAALVVGMVGEGRAADADGQPGGRRVLEGQAQVIGGREIAARAFDWSGFRSPGGTTSASRPCRYEALTAAEFTSYFDAAVRAVVPLGARFYRVTCDRGATWAFGWWVPSRPQSANGAFGDVIQEAIDRLRPPRPRIMLSPPEHVRHVVGIPTWLAIDPGGWARQSMTVIAGDVRVEVVVDPVATRWWIGDGRVVGCAGPGSTVDPRVAVAAQHPDCHHTFVRPSPTRAGDAGAGWPVGVEVEYSARARITMPHATSTTPLGSILGPPAAVRVAVDEVQAVRTGR